MSDQLLRKNNAQPRESGLELYRVIVMMLIVAHHYVVNSAVWEESFAHLWSVRSVGVLLFGAWGKTGINCFLLITGYFMCKSQISLRKYIKLILQVVFYSAVTYLVFVIAGVEQFSIKQAIKTLLPVNSVSTGFTSAYLVFFLFIPFLNLLLRSINEKQHLLLILLLLATYTLMGTIPSFEVVLNYVSWFSALYVVAAYFRLYPKAVFNKTRLWGWISLGTFFVSCISVVVCTWGVAYLSKGHVYYFVQDSNKVLAVATAVTSFLFFKNWKLRYIPFINIAGASAFGVLLLHASSDAMRQWLWGDLLKNAQWFYSPWLPVHAAASVVLIYAVGMVIDLLRARFVEKPVLALWDKIYPALEKRWKVFTEILCKKIKIEE